MVGGFGSGHEDADVADVVAGVDAFDAEPDAAGLVAGVVEGDAAGGGAGDADAAQLDGAFAVIENGVLAAGVAALSVQKGGLGVLVAIEDFDPSVAVEVEGAAAAPTGAGTLGDPFPGLFEEIDEDGRFP